MGPSNILGPRAECPLPPSWLPSRLCYELLHRDFVVSLVQWPLLSDTMLVYGVTQYLVSFIESPGHELNYDTMP